jgi:hypothetical protein
VRSAADRLVKRIHFPQAKAADVSGHTDAIGVPLVIAARDGIACLDQSCFAFSIIAASSFLMSASDNCGRLTLRVSLFSLAVSGNGGR